MPWEVASRFGLASPSAASLRSSSWLLTFFETSTKRCLEERLEGKQILPKIVNVFSNSNFSFCLQCQYECLE